MHLFLLLEWYHTELEERAVLRISAKMYIFSIFLREMSGWFLVFGIFFPVALLLILIISYLGWKLKEVNDELAVVRDPRDTIYELCFRTEPSRASHRHRFQTRVSRD